MDEEVREKLDHIANHGAALTKAVAVMAQLIADDPSHKQDLLDALTGLRDLARKLNQHPAQLDVYKAILTQIQTGPPPLTQQE